MLKLYTSLLRVLFFISIFKFLVVLLVLFLVFRCFLFSKTTFALLSTWKLSPKLSMPAFNYLSKLSIPVSQRFLANSKEIMN